MLKAVKEFIEESPKKVEKVDLIRDSFLLLEEYKEVLEAVHNKTNDADVLAKIFQIDRVLDA